MTKNNNKEYKEEFISNNQVMAMFEDLKDSIQIVAEGVSVVRKDLNEFKEETRNNFKSFENRMNKFEKETRDNFKAVDDNFKVIFEWQNSFSDNFDEEIIDIKRELEEIKIELAKRPTGKAFDVLESRITKLENRMDEIYKVRVC